MFLVLVSVFLTLLGVLLWRGWGSYFLAGFRMPGPPALPLIGNALSLTTDPEKWFSYLYQLKLDYGPVVRWWGGPKLVVFINDAEDALALLGNPGVLNRDYTVNVPLRKMMGDGIIVHRDEKWKTHRRLLNNIFHYKILIGYVKLFGRNSETLVKKMEEVADGRTFDPLNMLGRAAMESIRDSVFGLGIEWSEKHNFMDLFQRASYIMFKWVAQPWFMIDFIFNMTDDGKFFNKQRNEIFDRSSKLIEQKIAKSQSDGANTGDQEEMRPFADLLIEESAKEGSLMTLKELQEEMNTLIVTSIDTSSNTLASFLIIMGIFQDIQQQVRQELENVFGGDPRQPTFEDLQKMELLDRCLKETLRLITVAPHINREVGVDVLLPRGYVIPKGASVVVSSYAVHRSPQHYTDPDEFQPDRWLPENSQNRHPCAFIPFGYGKRNCIGQKYAMLQMKTVTSSVLRRFKVSTTDTWETLNRLQAGPIVSPVNGYNIQLEKLNK